MKKKKSEPLKATFSFSDEIPTYDDSMNKVMGLYNLIFGIAAEKSLNSQEFKNDEEKEKAKLEILSSHKRILDSIKENYGKKIKNWIDEETVKRDIDKDFESQ